MFKITAAEKRMILKRRKAKGALGGWIKTLKVFNKDNNLGLDAVDFKRIYSMLSIFGKRLKTLIIKKQLSSKIGGQLLDGGKSYMSTVDKLESDPIHQYFRDGSLR
jgi:hypothetical protein